MGAIVMKKQGIIALFVGGLLVLSYQNCGKNGIEAEGLSSLSDGKAGQLSGDYKIPNDVVFEIAPGTGANNWNSQAKPLVVYVGQTLWVYNRDSTNHRMHTGGKPCDHQPQPGMGPGGSYKCYIETASVNGTYDHDIGGNFYLTALDGKALYASNCASCHGAVDVSTKLNTSAEEIAFAIQNIDEMKGLNLTADQIMAITYALQK